MDLEEESRFFRDRRYKSEGYTINYMTGSAQSYESTREYTADRELYLAGTMRYIIDSRSNARATLTYDCLHYHSKGEGSLRHDIDNKTFRFTGSLEYRLAIPTTLTVEVDYTAGNRENIYDSRRRIDYHYYLLTVGLTHYLF
jgi:hypothetical protein